MAKLTAPLFSLRASGTIGDAITYASWKGIQYARTRVVPANPNSVAQQDIRGVFETLNNLWLNAPASFRASWNGFAVGKPIIGRNRLIAVNAPLLQSQANLALLEFSEQTGGAPTPTSATPVNGVGTVTVTVVPADLPTGWSLAEIDGAIVLDGDPAPAISRTIQVRSDGTSPYVLVFTALTGGSTYYGGCWALYTNAAGDTVRSRSAKFTGAPT